ncbi:MAG: hypothetical protein E7562_06130 [Ruminococcaceae bacterium]|nr:hypothetical protein [Oscillospiraceae bacterium]
MVKMFLFALMTVFAILGLCEVLHGLWMLLISPKIIPKTFSVVWLYDENDPVRQLHFAGNLFSWCNRADRDYKIAVYTGKSNELFEECKQIASGYDIIFTTADELVHIMDSITLKN